MESVNDYIQGEFKPCGIELSWSNLLKIGFYSNISGDGKMDAAYIPRIDVAIAKFIPSLLLRGNVSESGVSISRVQRQDIESYYCHLCRQYGLKDELSNKPKCTFL